MPATSFGLQQNLFFSKKWNEKANTYKASRVILNDCEVDLDSAFVLANGIEFSLLYNSPYVNDFTILFRNYSVS